MASASVSERHNPNFNAEQASEALRKAMKGMGTDEKAVIAVLTDCSNAQRVTLVPKFKSMYGKDLVKNLKSELGGKLEDTVVALMMPTAEYDAHCLRQAMKGMGTDEEVLIEIMCSRTNEELMAVKSAYMEKYKKNLEDSFISECGGRFKRLLVSLAQCERHDGPVDQEKAAQQAKDLKEAGEDKWGTDESEFNKIVAGNSPRQLAAISQEYMKISSKTLLQVIKSEFSGDLKDGLQALVWSAEDREGYFAYRLHKAMAGLGTNDQDLIRLMVQCSERNLAGIKQKYEAEYGKSLHKAISGECSGDYKRILLAICGE